MLERLLEAPADDGDADPDDEPMPDPDVPTADDARIEANSDQSAHARMPITRHGRP